MASTTRVSYKGTLRKYLMPAFRDMLLRDMTTRNLQTYFSGFGNATIGGDVVLKIKEVLSSVLKSAVEYEMLIRNPMLAVQIPRAKIVNKHRAKPYLTPEEFDSCLFLWTSLTPR